MTRPSTRNRKKNPRVGTKDKSYVLRVNCRLSDELIREIQDVYATGMFTQQELADWYGERHDGCGVGTINKIVNMHRVRIVRGRRSRAS